MSTDSTDNLNDLNRPVELVGNQSDRLAQREDFTIPVIEEQLVVGKQVVETGQVRIAKHVLEEEQTVNTSLVREEYNIERVPINQYVDVPPAVRQEGDVTIYPVLQEVVVTEKRLMLVEEVRVTKQQSETIDTQRIPLRREEIIIERTERTEPNSERPV